MDWEFGGHLHAIVVFILPTLTSNASLAKSVAKSDDSCILSRSCLDARGERTIAFTYRSWKVTLVLGGSPCIVGFASVKTA